jgi:hypothetical protein
MAKATHIPGKKVPQGKYSAFIPAPLPPKLDWTPRLIGLLSDADRLIGKLAGEGGRLPNPMFFCARLSSVKLSSPAGLKARRRPLANYWLPRRE